MKNHRTVEVADTEAGQFRAAYFRLLYEEQSIELENRAVENDTRYRFVPYIEPQEKYERNDN